MWFILTTYFPSGNLEFWYMLGKWCRCGQPPIKTLGHESLMRFPCRHFTRVVTTHCLGELSTSCVISLGKNFWKPVAVFLQTSPHLPFPFAAFAMSPFTVINQNHQYDNILSPLNPPNKSLSLGVVFKTPNKMHDINNH